MITYELDIYASPPPGKSRKLKQSHRKHQQASGISGTLQQESSVEDNSLVTEFDSHSVIHQSIASSLTARPPAQTEKTNFARSPRGQDKITSTKRQHDESDARLPKIGFSSLDDGSSSVGKGFFKLEEMSTISNLNDEYSRSLTGSPRKKKLLKKKANQLQHSVTVINDAHQNMNLCSVNHIFALN